MPTAIAHTIPESPNVIREGFVVSIASVLVAHLLLEGMAIEGLDLLILGLVLLLILGLILELVIT